MKTALSVIVKTLGILVIIAAVAAVLLLIGAQFWPGASDTVITVGDTEIAMVGVFSAGVGTLLVAWIAVAFALLVGILTVVFAFAVTAIALGFTALIIGFPFILGGLVVWFVMRRKARNTSVNNSALPPATTA
jgi:hypothetical protein